MKDLLKFIRSSGIFLFGNVLSRMVSFFMLPLYTNYITPTDFGIYDLNLAYMTFLSSILFLDIWGGIMRFMFDYKKSEEKYQPVTAGICIFLISTVMYVIFLLALGSVINIQYVVLLIFLGLLTNLQNVVGYIARALEQNYIFAIGGVINTIITASANILFIAYFGKGFEFLYISASLGLLVNIFIVSKKIKFTKMVKLKYFDFNLFAEMIRYSAPLCINSVAYWFLTSYNKVVIQSNLSNYENGLYAVANRFSSLINIFTQCFQLAWQELTFSKVDISEAKRDEFYTLAINEYIQFLYCGLILSIPVIYIFFPILVADNYIDAKNLIPFALFASLLSSVSSFLASIYSTFKKNRFIFTTTLIGSVVNILFINLSINNIGIQAANISLAIGFFAVVVRRLNLLKKFVNIKINYKKVILMSVLFLLAFIIFLYTNILVNFIFLIIILFIVSYIYINKVKNIIINMKEENSK